MKNLRFLYTAMVVGAYLMLGGCGGGGGGSNYPDYEGAWNTNVSLINNTCARTIPEQFVYLYVRHNVNQSVSSDSLGNEIIDIVLDDGTDTYVGVGQIGEGGNGDSFSATGSPHELPGFLNSYTCIETINFDYDSITKREEDGVAVAGFVTRHSSITCTRGSEIRTCDVTYTGSGYRG